MENIKVLLLHKVGNILTAFTWLAVLYVIRDLANTVISFYVAMRNLGF